LVLLILYLGNNAVFRRTTYRSLWNGISENAMPLDAAQRGSLLDIVDAITSPVCHHETSHLARHWAQSRRADILPTAFLVKPIAF
jgi:hypothetical protein